MISIGGIQQLIVQAEHVMDRLLVHAVLGLMQVVASLLVPQIK